MYFLYHMELSVITITRYIEWNNSSLAVPRKCYSNAAIMAVDVEHNIERADLDQVLYKLADVISEWNVNKTYNRSDGNCQVFIDNLMKHLGIQLKFGTAVAGFLGKLRTKGSCSLKYHIPNTIAERANIKEKKITFQSHEELDQFVVNIKKRIPTFDLEYRDDYALLKSFDRAFWLRHYKNEMDKHCKQCQDGCPFGDPKGTSLPKDWFC